MHSYKKIHIILLFTILMFLFTSRTIIFAQNSQGHSLGDQSQVDPSDPTRVSNRSIVILAISTTDQLNTWQSKYSRRDS